MRVSGCFTGMALAVRITCIFNEGRRCHGVMAVPQVGYDIDGYGRLD